MPNGDGRGYGVRPGEYTKVGIESEVTIPWLTYVMKGVLGTISIVGLFIGGWLTWLLIYLNSSRHATAWSWVSRSWWPWTSKWWPLPIILIVLWWATEPAWEAIFRFTLEQIYKTLPPTYQSVDLNEEGPWPFGKRKPSRYHEFYHKRD